ncbi:MAG: PspA/IM30 family protein [Clostridium sp.]|jgi:phage shock protein A|uniref:PspA/IM30 family protein n=1 Tax=Clostridium sp. TaxID=1506 RepID=UPI0025BAD80B|nr:PspA/IM30 family protein [Clostridium sp.]MCH3965366.1 PspA/IM30 family protein [Clostridium sp.]MCI1714586.1 PspA/IM30 family protein [Clostridium sp.]MCI1798848.1 PspA/IM30 family protein [Clostridium sp.]MCI1812421.1 PspA/IM30 family protein [Clostridium sp.]MCI1869659.1 PspA/IM30 family protein [Clostridium sp.]
MGVIKRISNIFRAKVNNSLDEIENPIELLDQKLRDMETSLNKAKLSSAQILGNVHEIDKKMETAKRTSSEFDSKVKLALSKNNEELAKKALERKLEADKTYANLETSYKDACTKAETIKKKLKELESQIEKTRTYRDEAAARYNNAEASKKVNEILANIDSRNNAINLDDIERKIQKKESISQGLEDLKESDSLDKEFEKLSEIDLDEELKKYK